MAREDGQDTAKVVEFEVDRRINRFVPTYSVRENGEYWLSKNGTRRAWSTREAAEEAMHTERSFAHLRRLNEQLAAECDRLRLLVRSLKQGTPACETCGKEVLRWGGPVGDWLPSSPVTCHECIHRASAQTE